MTRIFTYQTAALFVAISAILHLISPLFAGFSDDVILLFPAGVFYLGVAWGLSKSLRWLAYLTFLILLFGAVFAFSLSFSGTTVPASIYGLIAITDLAALTILFVILWRSKPQIA